MDQLIELVDNRMRIAMTGIAMRTLEHAALHLLSQCSADFNADYAAVRILYNLHSELSHSL